MKKIKNIAMYIVLAIVAAAVVNILNLPHWIGVFAIGVLAGSLLREKKSD